MWIYTYVFRKHRSDIYMANNSSFSLITLTNYWDRPSAGILLSSFCLSLCPI